MESAPGPSVNRLAVFTVAPNHRVPQARLLLDTVRRYLPSAARFLILADEPHPSVAYPSGCHVIPAHALQIPDFAAFAFRYTPDEFAAALKPYAFKFIMRMAAHTHCIYFAPTIELFGALPAVTAALSYGASFVLTPQALQPNEEDDGPSDLAALREGAFNADFVGISFTDEARRVVGWWSRWARRHSVDDRQIGLYVDQRFLDLVPGFVSKVAILRDPGLNVGAWNMLARAFEPEAEGGPLAGGRALGFFNYKGLDALQPHLLDGGSRRWATEGVPPGWRPFLAAYACRLHAAGGGTVPTAAYAYARFASGVPIPDIARRMFRDDHLAWAGDPFDTFEAWCHLPARDAAVGIGCAVPSLVMQWLQARQPALAHMPLREKVGAEELTRWWLDQGTSLDIDARFLEPQASSAGLRPMRRRAKRPPAAVNRADVTVVGPFTSGSPAGTLGADLQASLSSMRVTVERLDVEAGGAKPGTGRVVALCLAPDHLAPFLRVLQPRLPENAYRVYVSGGEVADLSPGFLMALAEVDEVWAPTRALQRRLALATDAPVLHMPVLTSRPRGRRVRPRGRLDQPYVLAVGDAFSGLDDLSAAVAAFETAFPEARYRPRLVVASAKVRSAGVEWLERAGRAEAMVLDEEPAADAGASGIIADAACLLSLHRGEALGSTIASAMALGVPVVGTDHGGCTDLLTPRTGFPVEARPVQAGADVGYGGHVHVAADPCGAAWSLREVFDRPDEARRRAGAARRMLATEHDPARLGFRQAERLAALGLLAPPLERTGVAA